MKQQFRSLQKKGGFSMSPVRGWVRTDIKGCARIGCTEEFEVPNGTVRYYCSKRCRLLARSKKGRHKVAVQDKRN